MEAIGYFLLWAVIGYFIMRVGCGSHITGHGHGHGQGGEENDHTKPTATSPASDLKWVAPERDVDPVCGKSVSTDKAKPSVYDGMVYYFCSRECREMFEAAPDQYVGAKSEHVTQPMEPSHV